MAAPTATSAPRTFRLGEVVSALTYALDLTEGQPEGHTLRACCIGMRIGAELELGAESLGSLFYALLMKDTGCSSNAAALAGMFGTDDHVIKRESKTANWTQLRGAAGYVWRNAARGRDMWTRVRHFTRIASGTGSASSRELIRIRCERGASIAGRLGFDAGTATAIRSLDEHWDGSGHPEGLSGDGIPLHARISLLAQTLEVFLEGGEAAALAAVRQRRGGWFDPQLVDLVQTWEDDADWWNLLRAGELDGLVASLEPRDGVRVVDDAGLDQVAAAFAEVIDAKSPYTFNHSSGVADWARRIGEQLGMDAASLRDVHRAGLLHDIGKLGVSNLILDKPDRLTAAEIDVIRRHPQWTLAILERVPAFATFARQAAHHHERMDGSGYPWGLGATQLDSIARILAVADVYEALTADRPYRPGMPSEAVLHILSRAAPAHYDPEVVSALVACVRSGSLADGARRVPARAS